MTKIWLIAAALLLALLSLSGVAGAHELGAADAGFVARAGGAAVAPFMYIGAKHMLTGYDHLLFLVGVVFFVARMRDVIIFVTLFTLGHSATLMAGVLGGWQVNAWLIDAVIALSVVYKAFDNLGGFSELLGFQPDLRVAVSAFGLVHGLGLATSLQSFMPEGQGLIVNLVSFNVGVEIGQVLALVVVVSMLNLWRHRPSFARYAVASNVALMVCGFLLLGYQLTGYVLS